MGEAEKKTDGIKIRFEPSLAARLDKLCASSGRGRAEVIRLSLDAVLRHFERVGNVVFPVEVEDEPGGSIRKFLEKNEREAMRFFLDKLVEEKYRALRSTLQASGLGDDLQQRFDRFWPEDQFQFLPLSGGVSAGSPIRDVPKRLLPSVLKHPEDYFALKVFGGRLKPIIPDGAVIIVSPLCEDELKSMTNGIVVAQSQGTRQLYIYQNPNLTKANLISLDTEEEPPPDISEVKIEAVMRDLHSKKGLRGIDSSPG